MRRGKFFTAFAGLLASPVLIKAESTRLFNRNADGFKVSAGEGRIHGHLQLKGVNSNVIDVKVSGSDTNGDLVIFEQTSHSQGRGTPLHLHHFQDEVFYVLEGEYYFQVGEKKFKATKGETVFLPRKVPHAWTQVSPTGKMSITLQPAGKLENFFVTVAALDHEPTPKEMEQIFADNEMKVVGPPLKID